MLLEKKHFTYMCSTHTYKVLLGVYHGLELFGHSVTCVLLLIDTANQLSKNGCKNLHSNQQSIEDLVVPYILQLLVLFTLKQLF